MIATPIAGWAGSSASGIDTVIFGSYILPPLVEPSESAEFVWFILHEIFAKTLLGMVIVHMLAALRREMIGDGTLTRMLRGRA
jgi:cytochrome b561